MAYVPLDRRQQGFTIVELAIVMVIVGALAGLAVPAYLGYLDKARLTRCITEIRYIARAVDSYHTAYDVYPNTLAEAGAGDMVDPWGNAYAYLNIAALTLPGSGMHSLAVTQRNLRPSGFLFLMRTARGRGKSSQGRLGGLPCRPGRAIA